MDVPAQLNSIPALRHMIGEAARAARIELGLTQAQAAEEIVITIEFYARIERGMALPSLETLYRISGALNVPVARLLGLEDLRAPILTGPSPPDDQIAYLVERARKNNKLYKAIIAVLNAAKSP
jgi:transcriptional regulator with XRE-family HTH domain